MAITSIPTKLHWNYFLALERDMESVSRYVEFCESNFSVYSIELARLLFAAASEVDVVAKLLCEQIDSTMPRENINHYKSVLLVALPDLQGLKCLCLAMDFRSNLGLTGRATQILAGGEATTK